MSEPAVQDGAAVRVANVSVFIASFALIFVAIAVLLFIDLFLARIDSRESAAHASSAYAEGVSALAAGKASTAAERFGVAVAIERSNVNYGLALGEAMLEEGRTADAESTLKGLLDRAENDGAVNFAMAHVMVRESRWADAKAYFHRAVFGRWGADSTEQRNQARSELIDVLVKHGSGRELLAELLPFEEASPDSVELRRRVAHLFILAGSPARAANVFRDLVRRDPTDADAYSGLGDAALALGNFRTARADLAQANHLMPNDAGIAARLALADTILALDPTARGLDVSERYDRSKALLARTLAVLEMCLPPRVAPAADSARLIIAEATKPNPSGVAADAMLALSTELWAARSAECPGAGRDEALRLLENHLTQ